MQAKDYNKEELEQVIKTLEEIQEPEYFNETTKTVFEEFDADKNSYLDRSELKNFLNETAKRLNLKIHIDDAVVDYVFGTIDQDKNNKIDLEEMKAYMKTFIDQMIPYYKKALEDVEK